MDVDHLISTIFELCFLQGFNERKVGFSMEEQDEAEKNESENEEVEKLHPIKLHRR